MSQTETLWIQMKPCQTENYLHQNVSVWEPFWPTLLLCPLSKQLKSWLNILERSIAECLTFLSQVYTNRVLVTLKKTYNSLEIKEKTHYSKSDRYEICWYLIGYWMGAWVPMMSFWLFTSINWSLLWTLLWLHGFANNIIVQLQYCMTTELHSWIRQKIGCLKTKLHFC